QSARRCVLEALTAGWRDVIAAAPDVDLLGAISRRGFRLIQALQLTVVAFVECRITFDRQGLLPDALQDNLQRFNGTPQHRGICLIETNTAEFLAGAPRLLTAFVRERYVGPAGKAILEVPLRFAVANQHEVRHCPWCALIATEKVRG